MHGPLTLVLQSFKADYELRRATLALLSYFAHSTVDIERTSIVLFTDRPDFFQKYLEGLPIQFVELTEQKLQSMRGEIDFLHRIKIAAIEEAYEMAPGNILYFDSDSFFIKDPAPLLEKVSASRSYMHKHEYHFRELADLPLPSGAPFHAFLKLIEWTALRLASGRSMKVSPGMSSWNAGVMMLHSTHQELLRDVYSITEHAYPLTENHATEQYAFSIILESNTELGVCESVNYHYWYRVKKQIIDLFLEEHLNEAWAQNPLDVKLRLVKQWTQVLEQHLEEHVFTLRDNAIQAFNENKYGEAYGWTLKALKKQPFGDLQFCRDVLYHVKRQLLKK